MIIINTFPKSFNFFFIYYTKNKKILNFLEKTKFYKHLNNERFI